MSNMSSTQFLAMVKDGLWDAYLEINHHLTGAFPPPFNLACSKLYLLLSWFSKYEELLDQYPDDNVKSKLNEMLDKIDQEALKIAMMLSSSPSNKKHEEKSVEIFQTEKALKDMIYETMKYIGDSLEKNTP